MQKFYKYFTLSVLSLSIVWFSCGYIAGSTQTKVSAQSQVDEPKTQLNCADKSIFLIEKDKNKITYLVYDFRRATVSVVKVRLDYQTPSISSIKTQSLLPE